MSQPPPGAPFYFTVPQTAPYSAMLSFLQQQPQQLPPPLLQHNPAVAMPQFPSLPYNPYYSQGLPLYSWPPPMLLPSIPISQEPSQLIINNDQQQTPQLDVLGPLTSEPPPLIPMDIPALLGKPVNSKARVVQQHHQHAADTKKHIADTLPSTATPPPARTPHNPLRPRTRAAATSHGPDDPDSDWEAKRRQDDDDDYDVDDDDEAGMLHCDVCGKAFRFRSKVSGNGVGGWVGGWDDVDRGYLPRTKLRQIFI